MASFFVACQDLKPDTTAPIGTTGKPEVTTLAPAATTATPESGTTAAPESTTTAPETTTPPVEDFSITWKMDDGTVIDITTVKKGATPTHANPTKASTAQYDYTFSGWSPSVVAVTGNATYTARFELIPIYSIPVNAAPYVLPFETHHKGHGLVLIINEVDSVPYAYLKSTFGSVTLKYTVYDKNTDVTKTYTALPLTGDDVNFFDEWSCLRVDLIPSDKLWPILTAAGYDNTMFTTFTADVTAIADSMGYFYPTSGHDYVITVSVYHSATGGKIMDFVPLNIPYINGVKEDSARPSSASRYMGKTTVDLIYALDPWDDGEVSNLFDGKSSTKFGAYCYGSSPAITFTTETAIKLKGFSVITGNDNYKYPNRNTTSFTIEVWDGDRWGIIAANVKQKSSDANYEEIYFELNATEAYSRYRISFKNPLSNQIQYTEMLLWT